MLNERNVLINEIKSMEIADETRQNHKRVSEAGLQFTEREILIDPQSGINFLMGGKFFTARYVKLFIGMHLSVKGDIKKKDPTSGRVEVKKTGLDELDNLLKNGISKLDIDANFAPGVKSSLAIKSKYFSGRVTFPKRDWFQLIGVEGKREFNNLKFGDWIIEGPATLHLRVVLGPNLDNKAWLTLAKFESKPLVKPDAIEMLMTFGEGAEKGVLLLEVFELIGHGVLSLFATILGPLFLVITAFVGPALALKAGRLENIGNNFAIGFQRYMLHYTLSVKEYPKTFELLAFPGGPRKYDEAETRDIIDKWSRNDKEIQRLSKMVIENAEITDPITNNEKWSHYASYAKALGAAIALGGIRKGYRLIQEVYGPKEGAEIWRFLQTGSRIIRADRARFPSGFRMYSDFMELQFKGDPSKTIQQSFPLNLYPALLAKSRVS